MEPELITAVATGGLAVLLFGALLLARRGRRRARRSATRLEEQLKATRDRSAALASGEREAAWALGETARSLEATQQEHAMAAQRVATLESEVDDLRHQLADVTAELTTARREVDEAHNEVARLDAENAVSAQEGSSTADRAHELQSRLDDAIRELENERAAVARLTAALEQNVAHATDDAAEDDTRARLVASEARRRDLEDRVTALQSVRTSESRAAAERIAALERLRIDASEHERRIDALESDLKQAEESRDEALEEAARLQVELVRLKGELAETRARLGVLEQHSEALADARRQVAELEATLADQRTSDSEVQRLRKNLEAERARGERIARRASETADGTSYAMWDRVVRERVEAAVTRETGRLAAQVSHLRDVVEEKEARLRALTLSHTEATTTPESRLPATTIKGIGPVIAGILADEGIHTVGDIAALTPDEIERLARLMPIYPGRIVDDDWVGQARALL